MIRRRNLRSLRQATWPGRVAVPPRALPRARPGDFLRRAILGYRG
jgi:hypothetical protein